MQISLYFHVVFSMQLLFSLSVFCLSTLAEMPSAPPLEQCVYLDYLFVLFVWCVLWLIVQDKKVHQGW